MNYLVVAGFAFAGGIVSAVLGYLDSTEPFNRRKFAKSVVASLVAGLVFAVAYAYQDGIGVKDYMLAILGGAGVDVLANRGLATIKTLGG